MGEFEENMHLMDIGDAESILQWSDERHFVSPRVFRQVVDAARYFSGRTSDLSLLRAKVETDDNVIAAAAEKITELEKAVEASETRVEDLETRNGELTETVGTLVNNVRAIKDAGEAVLEEVGGVYIDGQPAPWTEDVKTYGQAIEEAVLTADKAGKEFLDEPLEPAPEPS